MRKQLLLAGLILIGALPSAVAACGGGDEGEPADSTPSVKSDPTASPTVQAFSIETIEKGGRSGVAGQEQQVFKIEAEAEWEEFWASHRANVIPMPPLPAVDFADEIAIAVVDHQEPSGGFRFEIRDIEEVDGRLLVRVTRQIPGSDCVVPEVITRPFHIVRLTATDLEPELKVSSEIKDCG